MKKISCSVSIIVLVIALSLLPFKTALAETGGYLGVFGGYTFSPDADGRQNFYYKDLDVQNTYMLGLKVGYTPPQMRYLSFELEFSFLNPDIDRTNIGPNLSVHGDVEFYNIMYNMTLKYPEGKIHPYIGGGLGLSYAHISGVESFDGVDFVKASDDAGAFAWQLLAGVEFDLISNLSVDVGYRYFASNPEFDFDTELDFKTSVVTLGLKYNF